MKDMLLEAFEKVYGDTVGADVYFAPGRVNLIGEHTDYNGGHVFPCALTIGTYGVVRKNFTNEMRFYSMNFEDLGVITVPVGNFTYSEADNWCNYPKGVMWAMEQKGYSVTDGFDFLFYGNIPNGSGLSSSASIEVLTAYMMKCIYGYEIDGIQTSLICQYAENKFNGVNCGIMDQFAIAMGKENCAIFLDTADLSYEYAPIDLGDAKLVIACSNKKRGLGDSKYNERRSQCEQAVQDLQSVCKIEHLGELTEAAFEQVKDQIADSINQKRAKHAVYENQRTIQAVAALKANDLETFGALMNASHVSLRDDYEVTGKELDTLVENAWKQEGVIGSRMTGAGFGGCTVSIVKEACIDAFIQNVGAIYEQTIGYAADFYVVSIGSGPCKL